MTALRGGVERARGGEVGDDHRGEAVARREFLDGRVGRDGFGFGFGSCRVADVVAGGECGEDPEADQAGGSGDQDCCCHVDACVDVNCGRCCTDVLIDL